ncbi:hypothetical protein F4604DRAFT_392286 [Suillus subluteus]|nr:hypothetical protein F4604DRAFT_392286 [Suillus subluteus]
MQLRWMLCATVETRAACVTMKLKPEIVIHVNRLHQTHDMAVPPSVLRPLLDRLTALVGDANHYSAYKTFNTYWE